MGSPAGHGPHYSLLFTSSPTHSFLLLALLKALRCDLLYSEKESLLRAQKSGFQGFPGGAVVKNPPANAGDTGSSPGPGRSHIKKKKKRKKKKKSGFQSYSNLYMS